MTKFTKIAIDTSALVQAIKNKSIHVNNHQNAIQSLRNTHYYRISSYWKPSDKSQSSSKLDFSSIYNWYLMDTEIRTNVFHLIQTLEIKIRSIVCDISLNLPKTEPVGSPHFYLQTKLFDATNTRSQSKKSMYDELIDTIDNHMNSQHPSQFCKHYKSKYAKPSLPPIWMVVEILTYGNITTFIKLIKDRTITSYLSQQFNMTYREYNSFLYITNILRNFCAHHNKLYETTLVTKDTSIIVPTSTKLPKNNVSLWTPILLIFHVLSTHDMSDLLCSIIDNFNYIKTKYKNSLSSYGFPINWEDKLLYYIIYPQPKKTT